MYWKAFETGDMPCLMPSAHFPQGSMDDLMGRQNRPLRKCGQDEASYFCTYIYMAAFHLRGYAGVSAKGSGQKR